VAQPLVLQKRRRLAAERRSLRCATDRWLKPAVEKERDNILEISLSCEPLASIVRARLRVDGPLNDVCCCRSGMVTLVGSFARALFGMLACG
jgi:hypothetical protein